MRTATVTTVLDAPQEAVFDYMAEIENLPAWATEFARELKRDADGYSVVNGLGEFRFEIRADRDTGVVDLFAGPDRHRMAVFPTRAVALPHGRTVTASRCSRPRTCPTSSSTPSTPLCSASSPTSKRSSRNEEWDEGLRRCSTLPPKAG